MQILKFSVFLKILLELGNAYACQAIHDGLFSHLLGLGLRRGPCHHPPRCENDDKQHNGPYYNSQGKANGFIISSSFHAVPPPGWNEP